MNRQKGFFRALAIFWLTYLVIALAALYGWVMNIVAIVTADFTPFTGLLAARLLGVLVPPLGAVLGYV